MAIGANGITRGGLNGLLKNSLVLKLMQEESTRSALNQGICRKFPEGGRIFLWKYDFVLRGGPC